MAPRRRPRPERLLAARGDDSGPRLAFLDDRVEITSPSFDHGRIKSYLGGLVETWCLVKGIDVVPVGAWTQKDETEKAGVEPDESYLVKAERKDRPDLAIEVIWTSGGLRKLEINRRLGVREVWTWRRGSLYVHVLRDGSWDEVTASEVLPQEPRPTSEEIRRGSSSVEGLRGGGQSVIRNGLA